MTKSEVTFPYSSLDQAIQDRFAKIGGPIEAFGILERGYKGDFWRKKSRLKREDRIERALKLLEEDEKKKGGNKAERQLRDAKQA